MPVRYDYAQITGVEQTPQGGLRLGANLTRTGIFIYKLPDGSERREYRPPEEVFAAPSLATLRDAPVTVDHPPGPVHAGNYRELSVGHVASDPTQGEPLPEGIPVAAKLVVQDAETVQQIVDRKLREISCGYNAELDDSPGTTPEGEPFDTVQRRIVYNHVALGPEGWGRAGPGVALRLDSQGNQRKDSTMTEEQIRALLEGLLAPIREAIAGMQAQPAPAAPAPAAPPATDEGAAPAPEEEEKTDSLAKQIAKLQGRLDASEKDLPRRVNARVKLITDAKDFLGSEAPKNLLDLSDREIMVAVVKADAKDFDATGKSDAYVQGVFEHVCSKGRTSNVADLSVIRGSSAPHEDSDPVTAARNRMIERNRKLANGGK